MGFLSARMYDTARYVGRKLYGGFSVTNPYSIDYAAANSFPELTRNAADTEDFEVWKRDSSDRFLIGNSYHIPARRPLTFNIALNSKISNNLAQVFYIAGGDSSISDAMEIHATAGTNGGAVTITVTKESGVAAPGTGAVVWSSTLSLKATINTFQTATLADVYRRKYPGSAGNAISLKNGDRLSVLISGTTTALAGLCLTLYTQPGMMAPFAAYSVHANGDIATQYLSLANEPMTIASVRVYYGTKASVAGTLDITKESSTSAPGAGTSILSAVQALDSTAATVYTPALTATASVLDMAPGDRLSLKFTTPTSVADICVVVFFTPLQSSTTTVYLAIGPNGLQGTDQSFFIADRMYEVVDCSCVYGTLAGGAVKGLLTIDRTTSAPGAGVATQTDNSSTGFDLNTTINTVQYMTPGPRHNRIMTRGERLSFKHSTTIGTLANMVVAATLLPR